MSDGDVVYRPLNADDRAATEAFAGRIPFGERAFIDRSLLLPVAVAGWTRPTRARRVGAFVGADLVGLVTVEPHDGWMDHVGELRPVVAPDARNRGIARELIERGVALGAEMGLGKLTVEVMAVHERVITMFESLGFRREAVLRRHVRDTSGVPRDLILLSQFLAD